MFEDYLEQWQVMKQAIAPLRLTKWQMTKLVAAQLTRDYPLISSLVILSAIPILIWIASVLTRPKKLKTTLPTLVCSKDIKNDFLKVVKEGKRLYPDTPYLIQASNLPFIVYPIRYFDEIKRIPMADASIQDFMYETMYGKWTCLGSETDALWKTMGVDLARSVPFSVHSRQKDTQLTIDKLIGHAPTYKAVRSYETWTNAMTIINACSFVGRETAFGFWSTGLRWLPIAAYIAIMTLEWIPRVIQPFFEPFLFFPSLVIQQQLRKVLNPVVEADMEEYRRADDKKKLTKIKEDGKLPYTAWLMARYKEKEATKHQLVTDYMTTGFAANTAIAIFVHNVLQDIAARPDLQGELREELKQVTKDGQLPNTTLQELRLMDSVMRESFRTSPFFLFTCIRHVKKPITFSDGTTAPVGSNICVDAYHIHKSNTLYSNPYEYDPYRFLKKRSKPGHENRHQFVSSGPEDPGFGDGNQACPGRFFANSVIKVLLTHLLLNYDIRLEDEAKRAVGIGRTNMRNSSFYPDQVATVMFKSRA